MSASRQLVFLPLVLALTGCASTVTVEQEEAAGASLAEQVENQIGLYNDDYLKNYVDAVGRRLVAELGATPYSFRFHVVDQAKPNAFATPGGYIYLSRGIMALVNTEDELAGVLAHEISHVTQRHHAKQASRGVLPGLLTVPGRVVGSVVSEDVGKMINAPIEGAGKVYLSSFSRGQESEADQVGMRLAGRAGYDPAALAAILGNLGATIESLTGQQQKFSFFDSHPTTPTRVADIESAAAGVPWRGSTPFAKDQAALLKRLDGLWWGPNNPAQGIFEGQKFMQPDLNFTATFPAGWHAVNTPQFVGAFEPEQQAIVVIGTAGPPVDPSQFARAFVKKLRAEAGVEPAENRKVELGEWPAHLVRIADPSGESPVSIYYLWVASPRLTFQLIGAGTDEYRDALRDTAMSLRNLTPEEATSIVGYRVRIAAAQAGETLTELSAREDNVWSAELTAAANGLPVDAVLEQGALIKILRREPYL